MPLCGDFAERLHVGVFLRLQEAGGSQSESSSSLTIQRYEAALLFLKRLLLFFSDVFQSITLRVRVDYDVIDNFSRCVLVFC